MKHRAIVVNADDLGVSRGATLGIVKAHLNGVVTSASISPTGVDYSHAITLVKRDCPCLGVGLHFTLSAGKSICDPGKIPLLVDEQGRFKWEFLSLLKEIRLGRSSPLLAQIDLELEAQIQKLISDGIQPDHINSERHVHMIPGVFERVARAATRHSIRFVRGGKDFGFHTFQLSDAGIFFLNGGVLKWALLRWLNRIGQRRVAKELNVRVQFSDYFASYLYTGRLDLILPRLVLRAPEGITEIMVHPGVPGESADADLGNKGLEQYLVHEDRHRELVACLNARFDTEQNDLTNFTQLAEAM